MGAEQGGDELADFVVLGVGSASPKAAGALAAALGVPLELVVDAVYRAPARLLADIARRDAERLVTLVSELGIEAAAVAAGQAPARGPLFDIAGELIDPAQADAVAETLAAFLGVSPAAALEALLTPPGVLLGNVTAPTVAALQRALPDGAVEITASEAAKARYALFASAPSTLQAAVLRPLMPTDWNGDGDVTLFDLSRAEADRVWRRLKAPGQVQVVDQAFLRFRIVLTDAPPGPEAAAALAALAGVPAEAYAELTAALPLPVEDRTPMAAVAERLAAYAAAGFTARADLETFAGVALDVLEAPPDALAAAGLQAEPPFRTAAMPAPMARLLRARLESAGADVLEAA